MFPSVKMLTVVLLQEIVFLNLVKLFSNVLIVFQAGKIKIFYPAWNVNVYLLSLVSVSTDSD